VRKAATYRFTWDKPRKLRTVREAGQSGA
jgi:hypothetical protein